MKTILILLIACSLVLSKPLSPHANLPEFFRNTLENTLQRGDASPLGLIKKSINHDVSSFYTVHKASQAFNYLNEEATWMNGHSKGLIVDSVYEIEDNSVVSHFISEGEGSGRWMSVVNVVKEDGVVRLITSSYLIRSSKSTQIPVYHEMRKAKFGFKLSEPRSLISGNFDSRFLIFLHNSRDLILNTLYERMGSKFYAGLRNLGVTVIDAFNACVNAWKSIADNFKTTKSTTLKEVTEGKGFSRYKAASTVMNNQGIRFSWFNMFKPTYITALGYSSNKELAQKADDWVELAMLVDNNAAGVQDMIFDMKKDGVCSSTVIISGKDDVAQKLHLLTAITEGAFKLSPDVYIYEVNNSYAGGIFKENYEKREYRERSLKDDDIKALTALASLNAINKFSDFFKVEFKLPTDNPTDFCQK